MKMANSFDSLSRPLYHFLPESNWMNDPNGPFYDPSTGFHHLFYQYLTPRVWGHAISSNLIDWEILPTALNYTDESYTEVPGETPGVYSGSATFLRTSEGINIPWLSASTPTNDMVILAYPTDVTDEKLTEWTWYEENPVVYSNTTPIFPPGRDPTEFWKCGDSDEKYCLGYATQLSEGCPCSGISGVAIFSALFDPSTTPGSWNNWAMEGYLLNDTADAVMWECPDLFPLFDDSDIWMVKYSIGPGPSYSQPWGTPGPRDYYITGSYSPQTSILDFERDPFQWEAAMNRSSLISLDTGVFYASKTYQMDGVGRILWGWIPEERLVDSHGNPYGWAGAMALPRLIIPYQIQGKDGWYIRTPPLQHVLDQLYLSDSSLIYQNQSLSSSSSSSSTTQTELLFLPEEDNVSGTQLEILLYIGVENMQHGDRCGVRVLSSLLNSTSLLSQETTEFTDIGIQFLGEEGEGGINPINSFATSVELYVDTQYSTANLSSPVNRTTCTASPLELNQEIYFRNISQTKTIELQVLLDQSVIESFIASGSHAITRRSYPTYPLTSKNIQLFSSHSPTNSLETNLSICNFKYLKITKLRNANITESPADGDDEDSKSHDGDGNGNLSSTMIGIIVTLTIVGAGVIGIGGYLVIKKKSSSSLETEKMLNI
jgi:sucrose-6-phosphate hydrolase SacC (GH32 family)